MIEQRKCIEKTTKAMEAYMRAYAGMKPTAANAIAFGYVKRWLGNCSDASRTIRWFMFG